MVLRFIQLLANRAQKDAKSGIIYALISMDSALSNFISKRLVRTVAAALFV